VLLLLVDKRVSTDDVHELTAPARNVSLDFNALLVCGVEVVGEGRGAYADGSSSARESMPTAAGASGEAMRVGAVTTVSAMLQPGEGVLFKLTGCAESSSSKSSSSSTTTTSTSGGGGRNERTTAGAPSLVEASRGLRRWRYPQAGHLSLALTRLQSQYLYYNFYYKVSERPQA
jgi:hypothetical protein